MPGALACAHSKRDLECFGNFSRNLLLDVEDVLEWAVVAVGPEAITGLDVHELGRHAHLLCRLPNAAREEVLNTEHLADRPQVFVPPLK